MYVHALNLDLLALDWNITRVGDAPKWYFKFKLLVTLLCFGAYGLLAEMAFNKS